MFAGSDGRPRPIWRATIYYSVGTFVVYPLLDALLALLTRPLHLAPELTPGRVGIGELPNFLTALVCTGAFALYERRRVDSYGLPVNRAFGWQTFEGAAAGVIMAATVALGMITLGGMHIKGLAGSNGALIMSAFAWLGANICVGIAEEFWSALPSNFGRCWKRPTLSWSTSFQRLPDTA